MCARVRVRSYACAHVCACVRACSACAVRCAQLLYYSPELLRRMLLPHLEFAMNFTDTPYPFPWAPHALGIWPLATRAWVFPE